MRRFVGFWMMAGLAASLACGGGANASLDTFNGEVPEDVLADQGLADTAPVEDLTAPDGSACRPNATQCVGSNFLKCKADGSDWTSVTCGAGTKCTSTGCLETQCEPNAPKCDAEGKVIVCKADGSGFGDPVACKEGQACQGGQCIDKVCVPGAKQCTQTSLLTCQGEPPAWVETPCNEGQICFKGDCVECFTAEQCKAPLTCVDGHCAPPPLKVTTVELPDGQVDTTYTATVDATGGEPPYAWSVKDGALPDGVTLDEAGKLAGKATAKGVFDFTVQVKDAANATADARLSITIHDKGLTITSKSPLPTGEEGTEYSFKFAALGGTKPYGWMVTKGDLPAGLSLSSDGTLSGTPAAHGTFNFTVRVVDTGEPMSVDSAAFDLTLKIAPLEIVGDQVVNLFLTKAVILPLITVVQGIPIPYNTQLQAKGGVKPYSWTESEMNGMIKTFIPKAGIPDGLTLDASGKLSGAVTDTSAVFELKIPFVNYTLTGFFFMAQVQDSQNPADSASAIFLIPTIPVDLGGGGGLP